MQHSIAAHFAAWPARYVHPSARAPRAATRPQPGVRVHRGARAPDGAAAPGRRPADGAARPVAGAHDRARARQRQRSARAGVADAVDQLHPRRGIATLLRGARVARLRQASATSAGGIVIRFTDGTPELVVGKRRRDRDGVTWTLPKGTPDPDETTEQTAVREVCEETGLEVRIIRAVRLHRVLVRDRADADPQDRPLLPHGADRRRPRAATTTSSTRSAGCRSARPPRC